MRRLTLEVVFDDLDRSEAGDVLDQAYDALQSGGHIRIAVHDGYNSNPDFCERAKKLRKGEGPAWNIHDLASAIASTGFKVEPLEYFDAAGAFVRGEVMDDDG